MRLIPVDVEAQILPSKPAARALTSSVAKPSRRVNVAIFSSRKRFSPFCVPTHILCSRSSRKHQTRAADKPSSCEYFSILRVSLLPSGKPPCSRSIPCPRVPTHVVPLLSRRTVWISSVFVIISLCPAVCALFTDRVDPSEPVSQIDRKS